MDDLRKRLVEQARARQTKIIVGIIILIILLLSVIMLETSISQKIEDVTIMKSDITDEKALFIPIKELDTSIIAVKATDGTYRLAFDDCLGCYYRYGKHARFKNNNDNTGLICKNCKEEIMYDDMGFKPEESMPYPIIESEIESLDDRFIIPAEYLEQKKEVLTQMRKGNVVNNYSVKTK